MTIKHTDDLPDPPQEIHGTRPSLLVATSPQLAGIGGLYFEDCNEAEVIPSDATDLSNHRNGVAAYALDPGNAKHLWEISLSLLA